MKYYIDSEFNEVTKEKFEDELREYIVNTMGFKLTDHEKTGVILVRGEKIELDEERTPEQQGRMFSRLIDMLNKHYYA